MRTTASCLIHIEHWTMCTEAFATGRKGEYPSSRLTTVGRNVCVCSGSWKMHRQVLR
jgi:hypothetical protein